MAAGLTTLQHVLLVDRPLPRELRYALGVGAIWCGYFLAERRISAALIAATAGAALPPAIGYARWHGNNGERATLPINPRDLDAPDLTDTRGRTWRRVAVTTRPHTCQADAGRELDAVEREEVSAP